MTNQSPPRAIVFDYGNVISRFDVQKYIMKIAQFSSLSPQEIARVLQESTDLFIGYESGTVTSEEYYEQSRERCRMSISVEDFVDAYVNIFTPVESTRELIQTLSKRYRLGLLSNTSPWHFEHEIGKNQVFPLFEAVTLSYSAGARKPSPVIYQDILHKLQLPAGDCVYIDDIPEFARAATELGMRGVRFESAEKLIQSLEGEGVTIDGK